MELRKATKQRSKLRLGIAGPSGSGKTYSALLLASGMTKWDKIALIDTENGSGELYSDLGEYNVITLSAPFTPERYIQAIRACENAGMEVIIIDSVTHEWDGEGGLLDVHSKMMGNSFTNWAKITPRHNAFIQAITSSSCHVITTVRKKQDYDMTQGSDGKTKVTKVGLKEVQREGWEYELTVNFELDIVHNATSGKDRTGLFMDKAEFVITPETGKALLKWCEEGVAPINRKEMIEEVKQAGLTKEYKDQLKQQEEEAKEIHKNLANEMPDSKWGNTNHQAEFMVVFNQLASAKKWKSEMIKKNIEAILAGRELRDIQDNILIQYINQLKAKLSELNK